MPAQTKQPRLKNLDELFKINGGVNPLDEIKTHEPRVTHSQRQSEVEIKSLTSFRDHPFCLYEGERLDDMVDSIRKNGVLVPIIIRKSGESYEILSGHNRVNAAKLAGLEKVPAVILENIPDDEALIYVVETNLMQRSFTDMAHSEKAAVIATQHSKLFSQGKRNDILAELRLLENPHEHGENGTLRQVGEKFHSGKLIGTTYGLSSREVSRYLRIHQLISPLKARLDNADIAFIPAVTLSFLKENEQAQLDKCIELNNFTVDIKKADILRQQSEKGRLDEERIYLTLSGEFGQKPKPNRTPTVKVSKSIYTRYFKPNQSAREIQETVEKALEMYFSSQQQ